MSDDRRRLLACFSIKIHGVKPPFGLATIHFVLTHLIAPVGRSQFHLILARVGVWLKMFVEPIVA